MPKKENIKISPEPQLSYKKTIEKIEYFLKLFRNHIVVRKI